MKQVDADRALAIVSEEIERAAFGLSTWTDVASRLVDVFPGSSCVVLSEDRLMKELRLFDSVNIEKHHIESYTKYFAFRNPWIKVMDFLPDGACVVTERDFPVKKIENTEYYSDFVRHVPNFDAATGITLDIDPSATFRIPLHYSRAYAERYDPWAEWILSRLRGVLRRTANGLLIREEQNDLQLAHAALTNRANDLALVVNSEMKIIDANGAAIKALVRSDVLWERQGKLTFRDRRLVEAVPAAVRSIAASASSEVTSVGAHLESGHWIVHFSLVAGSRSNALRFSRPLVLLQARNLSAMQPLQPLTDFARMFMLTPAEELFCRHLMAGISLKDIAIATGVTFETARFRLRAIFQKAGVHRQGELVSLLYRSVGH
ncbi:helix-turn-helix transcriptional regulator [Pleomorphomonas diazotrophica]|nr:helix-turn-helix transcriptional regulator [Pleomorphomonas diazotrophica]